MAVLVTGAAGFIGSQVCRALLQRGQQVIGLDNLNSYYDVQLKKDRLAYVGAVGGDWIFLEQDIADAAGLARTLDGYRFEKIVHLAAQAGVRHSLENPGAYASANLVGHLNLLEIARQRLVGHMVYASSSSVYGGNAVLPFSVEQRTDRPVSLYAATKRADELMSESYAHLFGIPLTGLRFFTVYGPWGRPDMALWLFTDALFSGRPIRLFNEGNMRRDFTYIDDVVVGITSCIDQPPATDGSQKAGGSIGPHAIYNIGNNRSEELMRLIQLLEESTGRRAQLELVPMQPGDVQDTYADIEAIKRDHNFVPRTRLEEGVPRFVEWFEDYHSIS